MNELMKDIIHTADSFVKNFTDNPICPSMDFKPFDYSIKSLEAVDELLEEISDYALYEEALQNTASMVGCYVFETARRNYGGEYLLIKKEQQPVLVAGLLDFQVSIRAWEKVKGRLINGKEDNIPFYIDRQHKIISATTYSIQKRRAPSSSFPRSFISNKLQNIIRRTIQDIAKTLHRIDGNTPIVP